MNEQIELYENAKKRVKQKKRLYYHFILLLIGSVFLIILNKFLKVGAPHDWFVWAILIWLFLFILHFVSVFVTQKFMGKEWVNVQTEKLVLKQELKIAKLEKEIEKESKLKIESEQLAAELKKNDDLKNNTIQE